jgi:CHAT domain-containing protein
MSRFRGVRSLPAILGALTLACERPPPPEQTAERSSSPTVLVGLDSLTAAAESLYRAGKYAPAKAAWAAGLELVRPGPDRVAEARILTWLGLTEWRLGESDAGRARANAARALLEANGLRTSLPFAYNALGLIAWDQGRLSEAANHWRRTMEIARAIGDQEYVAKPGMNLGLWYAGIGELQHAREAFAASLTGGRTLGNRPLELRSLVNLAMVANRMGEPRLALAWLDSAASAGVKEDFLAEDNFRSQLAIAAWALGDPGVALTGLDSAVRVARLAGLRQSEAANLTLMADIHWEAGDLIRALGLHAQAEAIHGELDLPTEQGQNLHSAGRIRAALGHRDQARGLVSRALALHQQAEDLAHQLDDRLLLAELGDSAQLTEARRITERLSTRAARTRMGLAEARVALNAHQPQRVLRVLASIARDLASGLSAEVSEAEALRARAYASREQWDSAAVSGRRAVAALERIRSGHGSGLLRASFASFHTGIYGDLVGALLALGLTDEAFEVADAARGGWAQTLAPTGSRNMASTPIAAREELLRRIGSLEDEIRSREGDGLDIGELRERLGRAEREFELAILRAGGGPTRATQQDARASRVRATLEPQELMLAYLVTPDRLFVFTLTRDQTRARAVPVRAADVEARVRLARQLLADRTARPEDADAVLGTLSQWLLGPVGAGLDGVRRLVLVPHGALAYLPFAALKTAEGKYLVERYSLIHLPSASLGDREAAAASSEGRADVALTAFAPLPRELPATVLEVDAIAQAHRRTRVLVGRQASEPELRQALRSAAIAHVASHGVLNGMNPLFSRIELVPGLNRSADDDGRLEVHEVLELEIRSPLVFLSGCETGLGPGASRRYSPGEDYATLAAAFLSAGAGQVVATLWAIPDSGAAVFAGRFYSGVGSSGAAEALAAAQRALLAERRFRHPYYWAGYRLAGRESIRRRPAVS